MNAALDSPLEALALNHLAYGFLSNIWAWIAVITAAVSFWRVRALSLLSSTPKLIAARIHDASASTTSTAPPPEAEIVATELPMNQTGVSPSPVTADRVLERQGSVKMKFSLHYEEKEEEEEEEEEEDGGENEERGGGGAATTTTCGLERGSDDWERMMVMRMGDMGWYRWQDRTVLGGSVVRLWEGRSPRRAAAQVVAGGVAW